MKSREGAAGDSSLERFGRQFLITAIIVDIAAAIALVSTAAGVMLPDWMIDPLAILAVGGAVVGYNVWVWTAHPIIRPTRALTVKAASFRVASLAGLSFSVVFWMFLILIFLLQLVAPGLF